MKVILGSLFCAILISGTLAQEAAVDSTTMVEPTRLAVAPFTVGEKLVFSIDYGAVNAGEGVLEVAGMVDFDGHPCYRIQSTARSNTFFSGWYKVRDKVVSYVDKEGLFSRYFMKRLREGSYRKTVEIEFDHEALKAHYHDKQEFDIVAGVQDVLSAFYYVRTMDLEVGQDVFFSAHSSRKTYDLRVIVHRREMVDTDLGPVDCFVIQPVMVGEGLFKHEGELLIYLSNDERRIPVLMKAKLPVGSISSNIREYHAGTGGDGD